jgi:GT2 family glycosyltransferase
MAAFLDTQPRAGAVTAKLLNPDGSPQNYYFKFWNLTMFFISIGLGKSLDKSIFRGRLGRKYFGHDIDSSQLAVVDQPAGACLMVRRGAWDGDNLTDERFPYYFDDADLCRRIYNQGFLIYLLASAEAVHFVSSSYKKADIGWQYREFRAAALRYFQKYHRNKAPFLQGLLFIEHLSRQVFNKHHLRNRQKKREGNLEQAGISPSGSGAMEQRPTPYVAFIVVNWNGWPETLECLESILSSSYPHYMIVLVDNGSTNDSVVKIIAWCNGQMGTTADCGKISAGAKTLRYLEYDQETAEKGRMDVPREEQEKGISEKRLIIIRNRDNLGFAEGNNVAIRSILNSARPADVIFLLNNDARVEPDCLSRALEVMAEKKAGVVGCAVKDPSDQSYLFLGDRRPKELFYFHYLYPENHSLSAQPTMTAWGTAMLIRRDALVAHERAYRYFFNSQFFLYMEDYEFCIHARQLGFPAYLAKQAVVYHDISKGYAHRIFQNRLTLYYVTRNTMFLARRILPPMWFCLFHIYYPLVRLKDIVIWFCRGRAREAGVILEGLHDGYRKVKGKWRRHKN